MRDLRHVGAGRSVVPPPMPIAAALLGWVVALAAVCPPCVAVEEDRPAAQQAAEPETAALSDDSLVARGAVIGDIVICASEVFDPSKPKENRRFFRLANGLHIRTRESVIRRQLLFEPGDPYDPRVLRETERILRNSDGSRYLVELGRPFYALDTRWAVEGWGLSEDRVDKLYDQGEVDNRFRHEIGFAEAWYGVSGGLVGGRAHRYMLGFTFDEHRFAHHPDDDTPSAPPPDRTLSRPWLGYSLVEDRYLEVRDLDRIARTEDLNLGTQLEVRLGYSSTALGADRERAIFSLEASRGWRRPDSKFLVMASARAAGRLGGPHAEDVLAGTTLKLYRRTFGRHLFFVTLEADLARNLDGDSQLLLGGDSGLRGYPLRYQDGDRRFLVTVEQRFYTSLHLFQLVRVGGAVFADLGRAWFPDDSRAGNRGLLRDAGFGLRFVVNRTSDAPMVHVDVAFPLDRDPGISGVQWLVTTKETF